MIRYFGWSAGLSAAIFVAAAFYLPAEALFLLTVLAILEISLSFDNAIVNAKILQRMSAFWQQMFLTIGIIIAVFGMRLVLPIAIVAITTGLGPIEVWNLATSDPDTYEKYMVSSAEAIHAFGFAFLMMLALNFLFDHERDVFWIKPVEKAMSKVGNINAAAVIVTLAALYIGSEIADPAKKATVLTAGIIGMLVYLIVGGVDDMLSARLEEDDPETTGTNVVKTMTFGAGLSAFMYLEVIDASFSLDGVIGAFAISNDIVVIALGLGIGALWVRSMTIYLVKKGTLAEYVYLENGAMWAIFALSVLMMLGLKWHMNEIVTGLSGVFFIGLAFVSSVIHRRAHADDDGDDTLETPEPMEKSPVSV